MTPTQEQQVYKLLELLNSALKSNSVTKKEVRSTSDSRNSPTASQKAGKEAKEAFQAVASTMDKTNRLMQGFNTNLDSVSGGASNVSKSFLQLNGELNTFIGTIKGFSLPKIGESGPVSPIFNDTGIISAINNASKSIIDGISIPSVTFDDSNIVNAINNIKQPVIDDKNIIQAMKSASITTVFDDTNIVKKLDSNRISNETHLSITRKAIVSSINDNSRNIIDAINKNNAASMSQTATLLNEIQQKNATTTTPATTSPTTAPPVPQTPPTPPANLAQATAAARTATSSTNNLTSATTSATNATKYYGMSMKQIAGSMLQAKAIQINSMSGLSMAMDGLKKVANALTQQFMALANVGMGSIGNIYDLNVAALKSGMSMREYQELFVGNMELAARTMSIDNFDALTSANNGLLARMGVFGAAAKKLQVEIAQTATTLGVSQDQIPDAANSLINTFRRLNKTISMSSQEFLESVKAIRDNNHSVNEMAGLTSEQRPARMAELVEIQNHGRSLGLSAVESDKLGKALMEQRYSTVKERFKEAGSLQQMGAILGMSAEGNRAAELSRKRNKSAAETTEYASILSNMNVQMDRQVENSDNVGVENQRDVIYEHLSASTKEIMMGGTRALTANESAALNQEAFGKEVGIFGRAVGMFVKAAEGLKGNDLVSGTLSVIGGVALAVFAKPLQGLLGKVWTLGQKMTTPSNFVGPPKPAHLVLGGEAASATASAASGEAIVAESAAKTTWISKITEPVKDVLNVIKNMFTTSIPSLGKLGEFAKGAGSMLGSSLKVVTGFLTRIPFLGQILAMGIELFTGDLRNAMSSTGSIVNTIAAMVLNIPMSIVNLVLDGLEWVFGENLMKPVRQVFETMAADVMLVINGIFAGIINAVSWFTNFLPKDSKLRQGMDSYAKQTKKVFDENLDTVKKVGSGQSTLAEISDKNKKTVESTAASNEKAADANAKSADKVAKASADFNNTQYDTMVTKSRVIQDAKNLVGANGGQTTTPATAEPEIVKTVSTSTEPQTSTSTNPDGTPKVNSVNTSDAKVLESENSTALLKKIHETLLQMLAIEQMRNLNETRGMNDSFSGMMTRPLFGNNPATADDMTQRLLTNK